MDPVGNSATLRPQAAPDVRQLETVDDCDDFKMTAILQFQDDCDDSSYVTSLKRSSAKIHDT